MIGAYADSVGVALAPAPRTRKPRTKTKSPTQRSLAHLRALGYPLVQVVERWNPHAGIRQDLFGVIDVLAIGLDGATMAVQSTSDSNLASRVNKIADSDALPHLHHAKWRVLVHGWKKGKAGKWVLREVEL